MKLQDLRSKVAQTQKGGIRKGMLKSALLKVIIKLADLYVVP